MGLLAVGLSHRTAPVDLRESVDFSRRGLAVALSAFAARAAARETVVLSTCNRAEIYAAGSDDTAEAAGRFFSEYHDIPWGIVSNHLYVHRGEDAARHLFRVAAGLESLVVGEPQILGQVKAAYSAASDAGFTGALTHRLFHTAFTVGKRVRSETALGEGAVSISYAATALAKKIFGVLTGLRVLIVGAGEMASLTGVHLQAQGVAHITVSSRTLAAAEELAARLGGQAVPWARLHEPLASADIVLTATGAPEPVLTRAAIADATGPRRRRPLFIIDIAVPRDVEAAAGDLDQVFLYNVDDLQAIVDETLTKRGAELAKADGIVNEEVARFLGWMQSREIIPTVVALRRKFEDVRRAELARLEPRLSGLPPEARTRVDEITRLLVEKLLLTPTAQLKSVGDTRTAVAFAEAINTVFDLEPSQDLRTSNDTRQTGDAELRTSNDTRRTGTQGEP